MAWRTYRWDDSGAPSLTSSGDSLIWLLDAVLIGNTGIAYGSTPAAGWTGMHVANGDSTAKYVNAGSGHGIKVSQIGNTNLPTVVGIENGDENGNLFPTAAQIANPVWCISAAADSIPRPWIIFADDKRFIMWVGYNMTTGQAMSASTTLQHLYFAGDILPYKGADAHHFLLTGHPSVSATNNGTGHYASSIGGTLSPGHYMPRSHTQVGGSVQVGKLSDYSLANSSSSGNATNMSYPDVLSGGLVISPSRVFEANIWGVRGIVPGLWFLQHSMPGSNGDTFNGAPGTPLAGKSFMLLDACSSGSRVRFAIETSDTLGF